MTTKKMGWATGTVAQPINAAPRYRPLRLKAAGPAECLVTHPVANAMMVLDVTHLVRSKGAHRRSQRGETNEGGQRGDGLECFHIVVSTIDECEYIAGTLTVAHSAEAGVTDL